ncbi:composite domain of metallo-dependent hydrolase [Athelia psychrophila]|uniref:Composite domain of metallo-dependent hydrolase n=1 Tax=Athelia psychrophila TaxID=1759441 RepID=A0A166XAX0_9AGAM|nr:composite domain of metallo-dependent hydrolase [Fibularhizoctonia sp. CBS 109695]
MSSMDGELKLPNTSLPARLPDKPRRRKHHLRLLVAIVTALFIAHASFQTLQSRSQPVHVPLHAAKTLGKCRALHAKPGPPPDFNTRKTSDRFVRGTRATLLRNATIWTGNADGLEIITGDVLLDKGLIKAVGKIGHGLLDAYGGAVVVDLHGAWVTPGIVDLHSHLGVDSSPELHGADDTNSVKGIAQPWLRSLDGINTHDEAYALSVSGGVTTSVILPGSANAIGGQAFAIKLRPTNERTPTSMLLEPPYTLNGTDVDPDLPPRWRQMKYACGENPSSVYSGTRMDTIWAFRQAYDKARQIRDSQDQYCSKAVAGEWSGLGNFPEELQWEALVDVLRGRVKLQIHCYETTDLDGIVRLSNEFRFPIAAFHHAMEAYLVPDLLKKAYGPPPGVALFATEGRYKREAYRASEFAPRILADHGLKVVMKSDHPVLNSRFLLYEAAQAHYFGLPANVALASVISTPAQIMGADHRVGFIKPGYDADVVVWDSHPLALGATPKQVWIDGIAQLESPTVVDKPASFQKPPSTPNFDKEAKDAVKYEGLPPLEGRRIADVVIFTNVSSIFTQDRDSIHEVYSATDAASSRTVVVNNGEIVCDGSDLHCQAAYDSGHAEWVNLEGGSLSPGLITYGAPVGLDDIQGEPSTRDGVVLDPLQKNYPSVIENAIIRAADGLQFSTRDALLAYRAGVSTAVVAPTSYGFLSGLSIALSTGTAHRLERGAVVQDVAALHISIGHYSTTPSVSGQIGALRNFLFGVGLEGELAAVFHRVSTGKLRLVINVESADIMASLIALKQDVEAQTGHELAMTFAGASEAHILAQEIGDSRVGVILTPSRPFPFTWESRRILAGPPLTERSAISVLLAHNVTVGVGILESWSARNTRLDVAWAALESRGEISKTEALALASVNLEKLLGISQPKPDVIATQGGSLLDFESKVVGVISARRGVVDLL